MVLQHLHKVAEHCESCGTLHHRTTPRHPRRDFVISDILFTYWLVLFCSYTLNNQPPEGLSNQSPMHKNTSTDSSSLTLVTVPAYTLKSCQFGRFKCASAYIHAYNFKTFNFCRFISDGQLIQHWIRCKQFFDIIFSNFNLKIISNWNHTVINRQSQDH